ADELEGENEGNGNGGNRGNENGGNRGNGNGGNGGNRGNGNRNGNHGMNYGGFMPVAREGTFQDFLKCKPHNFSGTEGVVGLTRWKMPSTRSGASMTREEFEELVTHRVAKEMEAREAARTLEPLNENGDELEGENEGNGNGKNRGNGNGRNGGNGNGNRNGNHGMNYGGFMPVA
ncbi:hypothetical protein Tco_0035656, partial [Tanacetum coccineum]